MVDKAYYHCHHHHRSGDTDCWLIVVCWAVSLLDSMDSTLNTTTSPQVPGRDGSTSRDTTQDNLGQTLPETLKTQGTAGRPELSFSGLVGGLVGGQTGLLVGGLVGGLVG